MATHLARRHAASLAISLAPLDHRRNSHRETGSHNTCRLAGNNSCYCTLPKIIRIGFYHACRPPVPARSLNHNSTKNGIPRFKQMMNRSRVSFCPLTERTPGRPEIERNRPRGQHPFGPHGAEGAVSRQRRRRRPRQGGGIAGRPAPELQRLEGNAGAAPDGVEPGFRPFPFTSARSCAVRSGSTASRAGAIIRGGVTAASGARGPDISRGAGICAGRGG